MEVDGEQQNDSVSRTNQSSPFLALPPFLRHHIYTAAEVVGSSGCTFVNLNQHKYDIETCEETFGSGPTTALLRTCRTVYKELASRVYGSNHFFIRYGDYKDLDSLHKLSASSIRALKSLTIHLNEASCGLGDFCHGSQYWSSNKKPDYRQSDSPFCKDDAITKSALSEWHRVWTEHILPNLHRPVQLELHFVCDVVDLETGLIAMQSLLAAESQALLKRCSIRLSHRVNADLDKLAERTVKHVTGSSQPQGTLSTLDFWSPFRFFKLPVELQQHILSFTDLLTPSREVEWSYSKGMRFRHRVSGYVLNENPYSIHGYTTQELLLCKHGKCRCHGRLECSASPFPSGCYCRTFHSAFSDVHECRCWRPPTALFLSNKALRKLAMEIFFGRNRFILSPYDGDTYFRSWARYPPPQRLAASMFLEDFIPKEALPHLRFIELVFPVFGEGGPFEYCRPTNTAWQNWVRTLDDIKDKLKLSSLTVRVYFAPWIPREYHGLHPPIGRKWMEDEHYPTWVQRQKKSYMDVILPMKRLRGLKAFFAYMSMPSQCTQVRYQGRSVRLLELEEEAERVVMGYEYDAALAGKRRIPESIWLEMHTLEPPP